MYLCLHILCLIRIVFINYLRKKKIHHNMPKIYKFIKTNFQNTKKNQIKINILYVCVCVCFFFGAGGRVCGEPNWVKQAGKNY